MTKISVPMAMALLVIGNIVAVFSDALIKNLDEDVAVFQFVLFRQISAVIILLPLFYFTRRKQSLAERQTISSGIKWHFLRAHIWLVGAIFMVYSLANMPLATANAIFYAAPLLMLPLSVWWYKEKLSRDAIAAGVLGFIGVLIVIRPTEFDWGASAALIVALTLACSNLLIRKLPPQQSVFQTLLMTNAIGIPASILLVVFEGRALDFAPMFTAFGSSAFIMTFAGLSVIAYRSGNSSKIASAEYSGLLAAVIVGIIWFGEVPDMLMLIGSGFIIVPLLFLAKNERKNSPKQLAKRKKASNDSNPISLDNTKINSEESARLELE